MRTTKSQFRSSLFLLVPVIIGTFLLTANVPEAVAAGGFSDFAGNWRGGGQINLDNGPEAIRCRAAYAVRPDGEALNVDMTCASDSYRVHIKTYFVPQGNGFGGTWEETTRQLQGDVSGRFGGPGKFSADLQALGVQLNLTSQVKANHQTLRLEGQGGEFKGADITLQR